MRTGLFLLSGFLFLAASLIVGKVFSEVLVAVNRVMYRLTRPEGRAQSAAA